MVTDRLTPLLVDPARTALLTDFDGTLSPIVAVPADARPLDGVVDVLGRLARRFAVVCVVSGRPVGFLWEHLGRAAADTDAPVHLVGLYGMESAAPDGTAVLDESVVDWMPAVRDAAALLRADAPAGVEVELKGPAVAVHFRRAPGAGDWVAERSAAVAASTGLAAHGGRLSVELRPVLELDKGVVVRDMARGCRAVAFFGDDLGDLPAFEELARLRTDRGVDTVGVAVVDTETAPEVAAAADLSVEGPAGALALLEWLAEAPGPHPSA